MLHYTYIACLVQERLADLNNMMKKTKLENPAFRIDRQCAIEVMSNVVVIFLQLISEVQHLDQVIMSLKSPYQQQMLQHIVMAAEANDMNFHHQSTSVLHAL